MDNERLRNISRAVIEVLKPKALTVAEVREVLKYIDETIEHNVVLK